MTLELFFAVFNGILVNTKKKNIDILLAPAFICSHFEYVRKNMHNKFNIHVFAKTFFGQDYFSVGDLLIIVIF